MSWTCPGHYKVHVYGRNSPGCPVHGHCPVPLPALPTGTTTYRLAFVKWYLYAPNQQTQFFCRIGNENDKSCNIELWKNDFYDLSRDAIMPIHNIYSQFLPSKFT